MLLLTTHLGLLELERQNLLPANARRVSLFEADLLEELEGAGDDFYACAVFASHADAEAMGPALAAVAPSLEQFLAPEFLTERLTEEDAIWVATASSGTGWTRIAA